LAAAAELQRLEILRDPIEALGIVGRLHQSGAAIDVHRPRGREQRLNAVGDAGKRVRGRDGRADDGAGSARRTRQPALAGKQIDVELARLGVMARDAQYRAM
jgi:hypothetical protein